MLSQILPFLLIIAGGYYFIRNVLLWFNETKLRSYLESSPKGKIWVNKFGMEKTVSLSRKVFLPIGSLLALGLFIYGVFSLLQML